MNRARRLSTSGASVKALDNGTGHCTVKVVTRSALRSLERQAHAIPFDLNVPDEQFDARVISHEHQRLDVLNAVEIEVHRPPILVPQRRDDTIRIAR